MTTMGMRETAIEQRDWNHGEEYILLDGGKELGDITRLLARGLDIRLNTSAREVRFVSESDAEDVGVVVSATRRARADASSEVPSSTLSEDANGAAPICFRAAGVVVATPISALKARHWSAVRAPVTFDPPLSAEKRGAIEKIQMSDAVKILVSFSERFWPEDTWNVVCCDAFLPECWMLKYETSEAYRSAFGADERMPAGFRIVTFFACGETAKAIARAVEENGVEGERDIVQKALNQLDDMFGGEGSATGEPNPSRSRFLDAKIHAWSAVGTVGGAYSHPSVYAAGARRVLQSPEWDGRLRFAGEATNPKCNPCMHGAIGTGLEAATGLAADFVARRGGRLPAKFGSTEWFVDSFGEA